MSAERNIRLFVKTNLNSSDTVLLPEDASHYVVSVMRCGQGDYLRCFDGISGEYKAQLAVADKKKAVLTICKRLKDIAPEKDIWLLFAPLKKDKTDFVIEKSTELGVTKIIPVLTNRTNNERVRIERYAAQAIEAAEQCERLTVPEICQPVSLQKAVETWDKNRVLFFMDERRCGAVATEAFLETKSLPAAVLIGPEGGFDETETKLLNQCNFVKNVSLGPRILRAETAALSALTLWQAVAGDWQKEKK